MQRLLENIKDAVKPVYDSIEEWPHSWPHIFLVVNYSITLSSGEHIDPTFPVIAAFCHDLGRVEEEKLKKEKGKSPPHALLSIEPTCRILEKEGISGIPYGEIVEAVAVHSYKDYTGGNNLVKILQDADRLSALGPRGFLGSISHFAGVNYVDVQRIKSAEGNPEALKGLCTKTIDNISRIKDYKTINVKGIFKGLNFVLEWYDMLHFALSKQIIHDDFIYLKEMTKKLADCLKENGR